MNMQLDKDTKIKAARIAGSTTAKILFGGAVVMKTVGIVANKATDVTAGGIRKLADGIDCVGHGVGNKCSSGGEYLAAKADEYDPSGLSDEEFWAVLDGDTLEAEGAPA